MQKKKKSIVAPVIILVVGLLALILCLWKFMMFYAEQMLVDALPMQLNQIEAAGLVDTLPEPLRTINKYEGTCTGVEKNADGTVTVTVEYTVLSSEYSSTFEHVTLGTDMIALQNGDKLTIYINGSQAYLYEALSNDVVNGRRSTGMIMYGVGMFLSFVVVVVGVVWLLINNKANKELKKAQSGLYYNSNDAFPQENSYDPPPQPVYPPIENKISQPPAYPQPTQSAPQPPANPQPTQSAPQPPAYPQPTQSAPQEPESSSQKPFKSSGASSDGGYTSLDFSNMPPSKPMRADDEPYVAPKTFEEDDTPEASLKPFAQEAPQEPEPEPEPEEKPAAPSEPVDLNKLIKKGSDDPFNMKAEDYQVDPALEALIRKGADDPFKMKAEDYQSDPALEGLIRKGSDDPFGGGLKKEEPKRRKKKKHY